MVRFVIYCGASASGRRIKGCDWFERTGDVSRAIPETRVTVRCYWDEVSR